MGILSRILGTRGLIPFERETPQRQRWHSAQGKFVREVVFGMNDGMVETLGFVTGVFGAVASSKIIVITGLAQVLAGAISMGLGAYLSQKSFAEFYAREEETEKGEMRTTPEDERAEIRDIFRKRGFHGEELEIVVRRITSNPEVWLQTMMEQELGLTKEGHTAPLKSGLVTGLAYFIGAIPPLAPYFFFNSFNAFFLSISSSLIFLFVVGSIKGRWIGKDWWWKGLEMVGLGGGAIVVTYSIGKAISLVFGVQP